MRFSSSSSDSDLEEELSRNLRRWRREQRGIVRTASSAHSPAKRYTLPDGRSVEVRKGCIYIPSREIYVHVLQALSCPQRWFGDGRIPFQRRKPLSPNLVKLIRVLDTTVVPSRGDEISLADATENGFFVFEEVRREAGKEPLPFAPSADTSSQAVQAQNIFDPMLDTRFLRITQLDRWRYALKHPRLLCEHRRDIWSASEVTLLSREVCCYDETMGFLWTFNGQNGSLYTLRYTDATAGFSHVLFTTIPFPPQSCLSMLYLGSKEQESALCATKLHLVVVGVSHLAIVTLFVGQYRLCDGVDPQVTLSQVQTVALRLPNVTCCCTRAHGATRELPEFWLGAGRSVFKFTQQENEDWRKARVTSFATTDVTAMAVQASGVSSPGFAVAGMRNGTLQLLQDGARRHTTFDTTVRHKGSDIKFVYNVPRVPYGIVSIARDGEAKVWDARLLTRQREPVCTLLTSRPDGGQAGVCSAALAHNVLAVSSASTGLTCVDLPLYTTLFHTKQNISSTTRVFLGAKSSVAYELFTFSPYFTQRIELCR